MKKRLLKYLCCPDCSGDLGLAGINSEEEIKEGMLACLQCDRQYPIQGGIPRFVEETHNEDLLTGERFSESWHEFSRVNYKYTKQFYDWISPVTPEQVKNRIILEAGCGKGRHTKILAESGADDVIAIDIGNSVEVAYRNAGHLPNVHILQADIKYMPLKPVFDIAVSVGVLHHMSDPAQGFACLVKKVKNDGLVSIWVYGKENNWWVLYLVNPLRIFFTSTAHKEAVKIISFVLASIIFLYSKCLVRPWSNLCKRIPFLPNLFYAEYLSYIAGFDFTEINSIVFDHLIAPTSHYLTGKEVNKWYQNNGALDINVRWHNRNSWSALGRFQSKELVACQRRP